MVKQLKKTETIKCDDCGRFIPYKDIYERKASIKMVLPESELSRETYYRQCARCRLDAGYQKKDDSNGKETRYVK